MILVLVVDVSGTFDFYLRGRRSERSEADVRRKVGSIKYRCLSDMKAKEEGTGETKTRCFF